MFLLLFLISLCMFHIGLLALDTLVDYLHEYLGSVNSTATRLGSGFVVIATEKNKIF